MQYLMPDEENLGKVVPMLFSDGCNVVTATGICADEKQYVAVFLDDEDDLAALCYCDSGFAFGAGGALSMLPVDLVNEEKVTGELTQIMQDNLYEVMNILSSQLMDDTTEHLRLTKLIKAEDLDNDADESGDTVAFDVDMKRYGPGKLIFSILQ